MTVELRLGKGPARDDPRTLLLANYLDTAVLPAPPASQDWLSKVGRWPLYGNDQLGDCVPAGAGHLVQAWTTNAANATITISETDVVRAYSAISGYNPTTGANDDGCIMLDALNYWRKTGIGHHQITAYVKLDPHNHAEVKQALNLFGGLYVGVALPRAARTQIPGGTWRPTRGPAATPGSWGGHCIHVGRYTAQQLTCTTWGQLMNLTWAWFDAYVDEAYAIVAPDWLGPGGKSPQGLDLFALLADLRQVTTSA